MLKKGERLWEKKKLKRFPTKRFVRSNSLLVDFFFVERVEMLFIRQRTVSIHNSN